MVITRAFHSFWSLPGRMKNYDNLEIMDFEILSTMLSALKWSQLNGPVSMITDSYGAELFEKNGMLPIWDKVETTLDQIPEQIDPFLFWAAGKLYALNEMQCPCVMLDTDLIVWSNISSYVGKYQVAAVHKEELDPWVYPDPNTFELKSGYHFPKGWDFSVSPANTAFLYISQQDFCSYYVRAAFDFMLGVEKNGLNPTTAMCFAEQRILPMCLNAKEVSYGYLLPLEKLHEQVLFTHLWGYKRILVSSKQEREKFCRRCVKRLVREFLEYEEILHKNTKLSGYLREQ